ncbi:DUF2249 domain-containing protein [Halovivax limisalsi]|uniref:DUF2249 domain-containing protein n=1 Tax=Halovivax limisalsi TaxID=1453760 RepID=UPI001FFD5D4C|nr:DUF2249 domain-containing protein [Halovivax limisalsi]
METQLDLRDRPPAASRRALVDELDAADEGDAVDVVADRDVDDHLVRYQLDRDRRLKWTYADPDAEPRELRVTKGEPLADDELGTIDVRDLKPQRRHQALLAIVDELGADEGFVLVNDHDPKPLYYELTSMHGDVIDWTYRDRGGADGWRVEVVKTADSDADDTDVVTRYDVREIPKAERHPTIHHRYGMLPEGGTLELIAPHEPRPLRQEFRQRYGDAFSWVVLENEPERCRVHVTKGGDSGDADESDDAVGTSAEPEESGVDATIEVREELDVRDLPPAARHERIFDAYAALDAGAGFVLVNDHDPKPLYHQFEAEAGPEFRWEYRQREPGEFRVVIGKSDAVDTRASANRDVAGGRPEPPF